MTVSKTILLVDDDQEIVGNLQAALEAKGYQVLTAPDGAAGLALAQERHPDLVVVDMMMPKQSGFAVLDQLKQGSGSPKVMMMTANEGNRHRIYAEFLGVDDYLCKPFALDCFLASVERLCASGRSAGER
jgi:DNA-binding response OmpR family regulator